MPAVAHLRLFGRSLFLLALLLSVVPRLGAQAASDTLTAIEIRRHSVFDSTETDFWLLRLVNRLHITTRPYVIRQELLLEPGQRFDSAAAAETERNIRRLGVFRAVDVDSVRTDSGLVLRVVTRDGWSTRPDFRFRSTGGDVEYTLAMIEDNLLGTATQASLVYRKNPDRSTTTLGFRNTRLINGRIGAAARWEDRSDGSLVAGSLGQPFHNLQARSAWGILGDTRTERVLRFTEGREVATDTVQRRHVLVRAEVGRALVSSTGGYLRAGVMVQARRDDFMSQQAFEAGNNFEQSVTGAVGPWIEVRRSRFAEVVGYNAQGRAEDIDLSTVLRGTLWVAPGALGYERTGVGPSIGVRHGVKLPGGFAYIAASANGLFNSAGLDSGSVELSSTLAWLPDPRHLALLHACTVEDSAFIGMRAVVMDLAVVESGAMVAAGAAGAAGACATDSSITSTAATTPPD